MKRYHWIALLLLGAIAVYWIARSTGDKKQTRTSRDDVTVVSASGSAHDLQPDMENYRFEREQLLAMPDIGQARVKPEMKNAPEYKASPLRGRVAAGPVDDFGAPLFIPSETAMTDPKLFEQELAKHHERADSYAAARMDELRINTEVEKTAMKSNIDQAKAQGSRSPEEIKRAEEALARMEQLQKVLNGEKIENRLE
ncbi:MAG: hypothetical protein U1F40_07915 [Turneriella sp.]|nr:hypothetical protein [Turneriella sp.]